MIVLIELYSIKQKILIKLNYFINKNTKINKVSIKNRLFFLIISSNHFLSHFDRPLSYLFFRPYAEFDILIGLSNPDPFSSSITLISCFL